MYNLSMANLHYDNVKVDRGYKVTARELGISEIASTFELANNAVTRSINDWIRRFDSLDRLCGHLDSRKVEYTVTDEAKNIVRASDCLITEVSIGNLDFGKE